MVVVVSIVIIVIVVMVAVVVITAIVIVVINIAYWQATIILGGPQGWCYCQGKDGTAEEFKVMKRDSWRGIWVE